MKSVLFILCAIGYGIFPAVGDFRYATSVSIIVVPILLGVVYFVLHGKDWPPGLFAWICACVSVSRVAAYWWRNSKHGLREPLTDGEVWFFGGVAALSFSHQLWRWMRNQSETRSSLSS